MGRKPVDAAAMSVTALTPETGAHRPRTIELLTNGLWRVEWRNGVVSLHASDPHITPHTREAR